MKFLVDAQCAFKSNPDTGRSDRGTDAHPRKIAGFFAQDDLERRIAARRVRRDPSTVTIDRNIVDRASLMSRLLRDDA